MISKINKLLISYTAKNIYLVTLGNLVVVISGFLFTILVARNLTPEDFGIFSTITSLIFILSDLGELGIGGGLSSFLPPLLKDNDKLNVNRVLKTTFLIQIFLSIIISFCLLIFARSISQIIFHSSSSLFLLLIKLSSLGVIAFMLFNYFNAVFGAKEQFGKMFITFSLYGVPRLIILGLVILIFKLNVILLLLVFLTGPFIALLTISLFTSLKFIISEGFYPLNKVFSFSLFLGLNKLFVTLFSRLDVIMLTALSSSYNAGIYSAALRVAFLYPLIGGSLGTVMAPQYSKFTIPEAVRFTRKVFLLIVSLVISLLILIVLSPFVINFVYGSSYLDSIIVLQFLLLALIPFLIAIPFNNLLTYTFKKPQVLAISSFIQLIIILIFNLILIPEIGSIAPVVSIGIASFTAMMISFVAILFFLRKQ